jgi:hypothetical protein
MLAQRRNCFAIWADRLRLKFWLGGGKVQIQAPLIAVVTVEHNCRTWDCEASDFKLFAGRYSCSDEWGIVVGVIQLWRYWTSDWV